MRHTLATWLRMIVLAAMAVAGGCASAPPRITGGDAKLPASEQSPEFLDRVSSGTEVSQNDALRGILLLLDGKDEAADFAARVQLAKTRGLVPQTWDFAAERPVTKGRMAFIVYQACKMHGGLTLTLGGPSERYCLLELQYRGMITGGLAATPITGLEYVAILTRADTYLQTGELPNLIRSSAER